MAGAITTCANTSSAPAGYANPHHSAPSASPAGGFFCEHITFVSLYIAHLGALVSISCGWVDATFFMEHIVPMNKNELKNAMSALGLSAASLSKLLGVTPRAVSMWLTGERSVPGPAEAYINLFSMLPTSQRELEIQKSEVEQLTMKDGMYQLEFAGRNGSGYGVLIFENGRIYGSDVGNGKWDGTYTMNPITKNADLDIRVEMPAGEESVLGPAQRFSWNVDVKATMDPTKDVGVINAQTNLGPATAKYKFMRTLPE